MYMVLVFGTALVLFTYRVRRQGEGDKELEGGFKNTTRMKTSLNVGWAGLCTGHSSVTGAKRRKQKGATNLFCLFPPPCPSQF